MFYKKNDMKKIYLILLFPFLVATQCEEEYSGFETSYLVYNDSSIDLFWLTEENRFIEIESQSTVSLGSTLNSETSSIVPSEAFVFYSVRLYSKVNDDYILVYVQDPLDDELWFFSEPTTNRYEYRLVITDDLID
jgi:hypothetical protein